MASSTTTKKACRKHFIPLESNPEVFNELVYKLGISESIRFHDVLSLDDSELLAFLPRPAYGLILVFPATEAYEKQCAEADDKAGVYDGSGEDEPVVYFEQTIHNACGLYALLHAVSNGQARGHIAKDSIMARVLDAGVPLKSRERALALEASKELEVAYASVATKGDTQAPDSPQAEVEFHYICFVKSDKTGHLYQMDGDRKRPIDLGPLGAEEDVLSEACLEVIRGMIHDDKTSSLNFSLMALVPAQD